MTDAKYRDAANEQYGSDGEIEIDDNALVSRGSDEGAYVEAWVWVSSDDEKPSDEDPDAPAVPPPARFHMESKLNTISDFLINKFDASSDAYTRVELYEMLAHVTLLLQTTDGTLSEAQQAAANQVRG